MSRTTLRASSRRIRVALTGALAMAAIGGCLVAAQPAVAATPKPTASPTATAPVPPRPAGSALAVVLAPGAVLTLPAKDGLRDSTTVRVLSGRGGRVDVDAVRGKKTVHLGAGLALKGAKTTWSRSVRVDVKRLTAGTWRLRAQRSTDHAVHARSAALPVGTGAPVHVGVRPAAHTLYPYADGVLDSAVVTVTAKDETDAVVPVTGSIRIDAGTKHVTRSLHGTSPVQLPITSLPLGTAMVTTKVVGPSGAKAVRHSTLTLAPTGVGTSRIARSSDTVQPVVDGLLDTVVLTTTGAASAGSPAKVAGTLVITKGKTVAATYKVPNGQQHQFTWNGRVAGAIVPGTFTATLTLKGPQGLPRVTTKTLLVSAAHPYAYRVQDLFPVAAGNQQGLAVHEGTFYVGYDNGDGTSRIEEYGPTGASIGTLGPLSIGHAAELSYSTTTNLLYAANGGPNTPTTVWSIDPATGAIRDTFDLSALGPNGMVAVDDTHAQLLVFAGSDAAGYTVTPVALQLSSTTDPTTGVTTTAPSIGPSVRIDIDGTPQGMEVVGQQLWMYTSLPTKVNHLAKYDLSTYTPSSGTDASSDLIAKGEGEGLAYQAPADGQTSGTGLPGWMYVGEHSKNRISLVMAVTPS